MPAPPEQASPKLVIASRADPPLPLARLRVRGQLAELRAADLGVTREEAAAVLRGTAGPDLPETAVAAPTERTEGWADRSPRLLDADDHRLGPGEVLDPGAAEARLS
jgi:hypothetical protein